MNGKSYMLSDVSSNKVKFDVDFGEHLKLLRNFQSVVEWKFSLKNSRSFVELKLQADFGSNNITEIQSLWQNFQRFPNTHSINKNLFYHIFPMWLAAEPSMALKIPKPET